MSHSANAIPVAVLVVRASRTVLAEAADWGLMSDGEINDTDSN